MSKWNKRTKGKPYSRTLVFHIDTSTEREVFLNISMNIIKEEPVKIDTRLNRIEMELYGNRDRVEDIIDKLKELESHLYHATHHDRDGYLTYTPFLLTKLFSPPMNMRLWVEIIRTFDLHAELTKENQLKTDASIDELDNFHGKTTDLLESVPKDQHKDIQRFLITIALKSEINDFYTIISVAVENGLFHDNDGILLFAEDPESTKNKLLDLLTDVSTPDLDIPEGDVNMEDLFFEGGKMVFSKEGEEIEETELDHSFYDGEEHS